MKIPARVFLLTAVCQFGFLLCPTTNAAWAPHPEAGEKPDLQKILQDATELRDTGHYEEALQRHIWFHNHALEYDPHIRGVRLSFALADWVELGREYPKARQALIEIRDHDTQKLNDGHGSFKLFQDVESINDYLGQDAATYAVFKSIERQDKPLAQKCFPFAEDLLVARHEYSLCLDYLGDPQSAFERIRDSRAQMKSWEERQAAQREQNRQRMEAMGKTNPAFAFLPPSLPAPSKFADKHFIEQTRQLIEILVGANHQPDAEKIRGEALGILNDDRIKSAVNDAEENVRKPAAAASPQPVPSSLQPYQSKNVAYRINPRTGLPQ